MRNGNSAGYFLPATPWPADSAAGPLQYNLDFLHAFECEIDIYRRDADVSIFIGNRNMATFAA
jgi:hypothetical protein